MKAFHINKISLQVNISIFALWKHQSLKLYEEPLLFSHQKYHTKQVKCSLLKCPYCNNYLTDKIFHLLQSNPIWQTASALNFITTDNTSEIEKHSVLLHVCPLSFLT